MLSATHLRTKKKYPLFGQPLSSGYRNVSGNAKPKQGTMKPELKRIRKVEYDIDPNRYELRSGSETNAPLCPYGNIYKWVVFDLKANEYVRFAKSVFKLLINKNGK
ncbi:hypothetical protein J7E24_04730 [Hymenobacter sp. ISL-91]|nr:hypothetical protein [Hymenobacter sp. ISL-91]